MQEMTTEAFLELLLQLGETDLSLEELRERGILEELDLLELQQPPKRDRAARIVHQYLRRIKGEADEETQSLAGKLLDLYDCRTCVNHIIQVIEKGIFEPKRRRTTDGEKLVFGNRESVNREEILEICVRATRPEKRIPIGQGGAAAFESRTTGASPWNPAILAPDKWQYAKKLLVDVRPVGENEELNLPEAVRCSLTAILEGNFDDMFRPYDCILFFCGEGYRSRIAANYVRDKLRTDAFGFALQGNEKPDFEH